MTYADKLRDPRWQKLRLEILQRAGWKCECCGASDLTLQVHHLIYSKGEPWDAPPETLESLCENCHQWREAFNTFFAGRSLVATGYCQWLHSILSEGLAKSLPGVSPINLKNLLPPVQFFNLCYDSRIARRTDKPALRSPNPSKTPAVTEQAQTSNRPSKAQQPLETANVLQPYQTLPPDTLSTENGNPPHNTAVNTLCSNVC